jgi:hypothetical protein
MFAEGRFSSEQRNQQAEKNTQGHAQRHAATRRDTTRHDTTRHDTTRHDTTRHDTTSATVWDGRVKAQANAASDW